MDKLCNPKDNLFKSLMQPKFSNGKKVTSVMDEIRIQEMIRQAETKKVYSTKVSEYKQMT